MIIYPKLYITNKKHLQGVIITLKLSISRLKPTNLKNSIMKLYQTILIWLLSSLLVLLIGEFIMQDSFQDFYCFITQHPLTFLMNYTELLLISSIAFLFVKTKSILFLIHSFITILYICNKAVTLTRGTPVVWADIYSINEGLAMINSYGLTKYLIPSLLILGLIIYVFIFIYRKEKVNTKYTIFQLIGLPIVIFSVFLPKLAMKACVAFNKKPEICNYDLKYSYKINGSLYSFLNSINEFKVLPPEGYSEEAINTITSKVTDYQNNLKENTYSQDTQPNIIFIQLESFLDPNRFENINIIQDPIPTIHNLMNNYTSGTLQASCFGGGTVRCEFETLTGFSTALLPAGIIPNNNILKAQSVNSVARVLSDIGYTSSLVHNYTGAFYSRDTAVKSYGFDYYISKEFMGVPNNHGTFDYPEDTLNLDTMKALLDNSQNNPQFIYNVTVESHGPYSTEDFNGEYMVSSDILSKRDLNEVQSYFSKLKGLDNYIANLIDLLNQTSRPTILVMYSDHLPSLEVTRNINSTPLQTDTFTKKEKYTTEIIVWDNISDTHASEEIDLETYQVPAYIANRYNFPTTLPAALYYAYNNEPYDEYINALTLLQYDILYGKNYSQKNLNLKPIDTTMGLHNIELHSYEINNSTVTLKGKNFTLYSTIILNNKLVPTTYIDPNTLEVNLDDLSEGNIHVGQISTVVNSAKILRESNTIHFSNNTTP